MLKLSYPEKINLYINSTNSNDKSKFEVIIPDGILKCEQYEEFFLNIIQFNTFHNFFNIIDKYNNNFDLIIEDIVIVNGSIPEGNININTVMNYINNHDILKLHIKIIYDKNKNKFEFQKINNNSNLKLRIINSFSILGFNRNETLLNIPCTSSIPINVQPITNIFIHLESGYDLNIADGNLDNHSSQIVKSNSIILSIPVNKNYNNMIVYNNNDGGNSFYFKCNKQESITNLCLSIRDQYGVIVPNFPESHIILQFQKRLNNNPYIYLLEKIQDHIYKIMLIISSYFLNN